MARMKCRERVLGGWTTRESDESRVFCLARFACYTFDAGHAADHGPVGHMISLDYSTVICV